MHPMAGHFILKHSIRVWCNNEFSSRWFEKKNFEKKLVEKKANADKFIVNIYL